MDTDNKMNGGANYFGHETLIADEYGEEVACAGWNARYTRFVAPSGKHTNINIAKAGESDERFRSSTFPKCP